MCVCVCNARVQLRSVPKSIDDEKEAEQMKKEHQNYTQTVCLNWIYRIHTFKEIVQTTRHGKNTNSIYILNETSELNKDKNNNEHDNIAHSTPFLYAEVRVFGGKWSCTIRINTWHGSTFSLSSIHPFLLLNFSYVCTIILSVYT